MEMIEVGTWAEEAFAEAARDLSLLVPRAIRAAHAAALTAHVSAEMTSHDTYGHTLKVKQYEILVDYIRDVPGVTTRKPAGMRFELAVIPQTNVAILPLRYTTDPKEKREDSRLPSPVSDLRKSLLGLNSSAAPRQLTIEHAFEDDDTLAVSLDELEDVDKQLRKFGRIVVVGYASNPTTGVWGIGWGDLEIEDQATGEVLWKHWESLLDDATLPSLQDVSARPVASVVEAPTRFDSTLDEDDFNLAPRVYGSETPLSEPESEPKATGNEAKE
ncbi:hypothetical protein OUO20_18500 [Arthrobacter sp. FX8]|uniref:hypothetical protein n=1 Tax=Arthrobacter sp. FX8 TaxID=2997335 RepID=UPI00227CA71B|nr:hypothetical protein [Arthrobacter sp. FX8]WAJ33023.1 hypothetical protein OUO20_18500 [Arthrobacter sp. FX8]